MQSSSCACRLPSQVQELCFDVAPIKRVVALSGKWVLIKVSPNLLTSSAAALTAVWTIVSSHLKGMQGQMWDIREEET